MRRILLAYDGDAASQAALDLVIELASAIEVTITVASVVPVGSDGSTPPFDNRGVHRRLADEACAQLRERGIEAEAVVPEGDPAEAIDDYARANDFDTIVVGAHTVHRHGLRLGSSVSAEVAKRAEATVIVAR